MKYTIQEVLQPFVDKNQVVIRGVTDEKPPREVILFTAPDTDATKLAELVSKKLADTATPEVLVSSGAPTAAPTPTLEPLVGTDITIADPISAPTKEIIL